MMFSGRIIARRMFPRRVVAVALYAIVESLLFYHSYVRVWIKQQPLQCRLGFRKPHSLQRHELANQKRDFIKGSNHNSHFPVIVNHLFCIHCNITVEISDYNN